MVRQWRLPPHQINVITALIRQSFILNGAQTVRGREGDRKAGKESFSCIRMSAPRLPLISSAALSLTMMGSPAIVCPGLFKSNTLGGNSWGSRGPLLSHIAKATPPETQRAKHVDGLTCPSLLSCRNSGTALSFSG